MISITKFSPGNPATAERFNLPLADCDTNFFETGNSLSSLLDRVAALESGLGNSVSQIPIGTILAYGGIGSPEGFLPCDGSSFLKESHLELWQILGNTFGGDMTYGLTPNLQGRFPIGAGQQIGGSSFSVGDVGGEEGHKLIVGEIPITTGTGGQSASMPSYTWKNNSTITCDGVDISLPTDLDTGSETANTRYFVWKGEGNLFKFSLSNTSVVGLSSPILLPGLVRNDDSSNIIPFAWHGNYYQYKSPIDLVGSDKTQIFSGTSPTTNTSLDISGFAPASNRVALSCLAGLFAGSTGAANDALLWFNDQVYPLGSSFVEVAYSSWFTFVGGDVNVDTPITWRSRWAFPLTRISVKGFWDKRASNFTGEGTGGSSLSFQESEEHENLPPFLTVNFIIRG